jgi:hypothetical protein
MVLVRENVYLYDVQVSTCLVDAYEDYDCFEVFCHVRGFKMKQRSTVRCCVKLKKTATETFIKNSVSEWHKRFKEEQESL